MSKHSPFFKFDASSWMSGSIQFATLEQKGLFIDFCAMYWNTWKPVKIDTKFRVRYRYDEPTLADLIHTLADLDLIKKTEGGYIVPFLDILMIDRIEWSAKCSEWGKMRSSQEGRPAKKKEERRKKKEDSRKNKEYTEQFLALWQMYGLKGSKSKSFAEWRKLSNIDKDDATKAIPDYLKETPDRQYRKDFERYFTHREFEGVLERKEKGELNIHSGNDGTSSIDAQGIRVDPMCGYRPLPQDF